MSAEPAGSFVDTNVLVYALAKDDRERSPVAQQMLRDLMEADTLRTSTQVLQELYVTLTRKVSSPLSAPQATRYLDRLASWPVATIDYRSVRAAIDLSVDSRISFWDALIVVAAANSGAKLLYTEDLQHGQVLLGVEIVNPFRAKRS
jgi:predicted nucleic acid-binding protein